MWPTLGSSFITDSPMVVLPQPDSPTRPRHSPERTENDTASTARTFTVRKWNSVWRFSTSSTGVEVPAALREMLPSRSGWFSTGSGYPTRAAPSRHSRRVQLLYQGRYTSGRITRDGASNYGRTRSLAVAGLYRRRLSSRSTDHPDSTGTSTCSARP